MLDTKNGLVRESSVVYAPYNYAPPILYVLVSASLVLALSLPISRLIFIRPPSPPHSLQGPPVDLRCMD